MSAEIIYVKISNERNRDLAITTKIYEEADGTRFAVKYATYSEGKGQLQRIYDAYRDLKDRFKETEVEVLPCEQWNGGLRFPYITGQTLEDCVNHMLEQGEYEKAKTYICQHLACIRSVYQEKEFEQTAEFRQIFGDIHLTKKYMCGTMNNIDMVLDNLVLVGKTSYLFDYEWTFDFPVPLDFMLYRILHYFVYRNKRCEELLAHGFMTLLDLSTDERNVFEEM